MADRTPDNADLAVDELRRKGRRRLVGAIVLALAAAIVVPVLLEQDPRPLGDDVSVQIPPVDEGKFISRLTGKSTPAKALPKPEARGEAKAPVAEPDLKREATPAPPSAAPIAAPTSDAASPPTASVSAPVVPAAKKSIAEAEQRVLAPTMKPLPPQDVRPQAGTRPEVVAAAPSATTVAPVAAPADTGSRAESKPEPAAAPATANGFVVQLAAFADDKGANALAGKLKKSGYAAYVEPVQTSRGTLWRVRVGGYAARADADAARVKLKGEGYSGIVAAAK